MAHFLTLDSVRVGFPIQKGLFRRTHGHKIVLDNVSFNIPRGQTVGLVGESGSGKTTVGRAILNLVPVLSGGIRYYPAPDVNNFMVLGGLREKQFRSLRQKLQIIFQDPYSSLNPRLRVGDILMEGLRVHFVKLTPLERRRKCAETLERVGLSDASMDRFPHEFSGGQRQRVSIARALVLDPEFVVCDECVSALDVSIQAQILNLLRDLQAERGLTYLFISHDLSVVRHISHEICVLNGGRIVEQGETAKVMANPQHQYTRTLIAALPSLVPLR
ncbi:MAG: ATP-binding cassette domain-containing protein [Spirochaetia bacterium]|nr:ATP-binding cassette domain-containing protein [Spirochaetia bacterium]